MDQPQKKALSDFHPQWINLTNKATNYFEALTPDERIWFTVAGLIYSTNTGGLIAHYYGSSANYNAETLTDLETLGFPDIADMLKEINKLFPDCKVPVDITERNDIIAAWPYNENEDLLEDLDQDFTRREKALEAALVSHIETKILSGKH